MLGYVQAKKWGVSLRRGHHEPLISFATYEKIQKNLEEGARGPARADFSEDFPLRGFVTCSECGNQHDRRVVQGQVQALRILSLR